MSRIGTAGWLIGAWLIVLAIGVATLTFVDASLNSLLLPTAILLIPILLGIAAAVVFLPILALYTMVFGDEEVELYTLVFGAGNFMWRKRLTSAAITLAVTIFILQVGFWPAVIGLSEAGSWLGMAADVGTWLGFALTALFAFFGLYRVNRHLNASGLVVAAVQAKSPTGFLMDEN